MVYNGGDPNHLHPLGAHPPSTKYPWIPVTCGHLLTPINGISNLQLEDKKVTLNHLESICQPVSPSLSSESESCSLRVVTWSQRSKVECFHQKSSSFGSSVFLLEKKNLRIHFSGDSIRDLFIPGSLGWSFYTFPTGSRGSASPGVAGRVSLLLADPLWGHLRRLQLRVAFAWPGGTPELVGGESVTNTPCKPGNSAGSLLGWWISVPLLNGFSIVTSNERGWSLVTNWITWKKELFDGKVWLKTWNSPSRC